MTDESLWYLIDSKMNAIKSVEKEFDFLSKGADPVIDSWLLMDTPLNVLIIILFYLAFILKIGPKFMEHRKPYELKYIIFFYNLYQVIFSVSLCVGVSIRN